jgi:hypothetical protein
MRRLLLLGAAAVLSCDGRGTSPEPHVVVQDTSARGRQSANPHPADRPDPRHDTSARGRRGPGAVAQAGADKRDTSARGRRPSQGHADADAAAREPAASHGPR